MTPLFLVIKTDGTVWLTASRADAIAVSASPIYRAELHNSVHPGAAVKIASITGNSPTYGVTDAVAADFNVKHARSF